MLDNYPAIYSDRHGEERTIIINDGNELRMTLRGVGFVGRDFDSFKPATDWTDPSLEPFTLNRWGQKQVDLCDCMIAWDMSLPVVVGGAGVKGVLHTRLVLGTPNERGLLNAKKLYLTLDIDGATYASGGRSGWFEDELLTLQKALPEGVYLKICFSCAFSDYSVYGHGLFGNMLCFRDQKATYIAVSNKDEYMDIMEAFSELVQETYLCPEFGLRTPGTGYRG